MRCRIEPGVRVILDDDAWRGAEEGAGLIGGDLVRGLNENGLPVPNWHRDSDTRSGDPKLRQMQDLARLVDDLDLFLVETIRFRSPSARHYVVGQLVGVGDSLRFCACRDRLGLLFELVD